MLELVKTIEQLVRNMKEYQKAVRVSNKITPSLVRAWYYIPALDMVGASRFIGYKDMTSVRYDQSKEIDGRQTEPHLQEKAWFRQLQVGEPYYARAYQLAESLDKKGKGRVYKDARFYVLKDIYDKQLRKYEQRDKQ